MSGINNPTFTDDNSVFTIPKTILSNEATPDNTSKNDNESTAGSERDSWGKGIEFLLACIALSVGLGNIWRFPFVALGN